MLDAGSTGIQQTDLTALTYGGSSSHHRQDPDGSGWPHRSHCGEGSRGRRAQHSVHTNPISVCDNSRSHDTHTRGRRRSSAPEIRLRSRVCPKPALRAATAASPPDRGRCRTTAEMSVLPAPATSSTHRLRGCLWRGRPAPTACPLACTQGPLLPSTFR